MFLFHPLLGSHVTHIPLNSRCLMKRSNQIRHVYLVGAFQRWTPWAAMDKLTWCAEPISPHDKLLGSRYSQSWLKRSGSPGYIPHYDWVVHGCTRIQVLGRSPIQTLFRPLASSCKLGAPMRSRVKVLGEVVYLKICTAFAKLQHICGHCEQVTRTGHSYQERSPPSIDLRLSTETTVHEDEEHQKLNTELRTLQQQLQDVIQKISQVLDNSNIVAIISNRLPHVL